MNFLFVPSWFPEPIAKAIGWTLIHSLWQGLLVTFIAGSMILFTRRSAASTRYKLLSFLLFAFVAGAVATFVIEYSAAAKGNEVVAVVNGTGVDLSSPVLNASVINGSDGGQSFFSRGYLEQFTNYFNSNAPLIVTIWFIIFLFKCLRLTADIGLAQRMRKHKVSPLPALQKRLDELAVQMKIKASVIIRESSIAKVPSVIGFLKPVILLPVGLLANLPADQVEAILLHELAHIRRKDYLVNLLQSMVVTLFFFNPSILWLSSLIRQERENCCDDMAISIIGKKMTYINALVAFQEYSSESTYAQAFPGERYPVLQRIKRIVYNHNKNLNNMEKILLSSGIVLCAALVLTFSTTSAQEPVKTGQDKNKTQQVIDDKKVVNAPEVIDARVKVKDFTGTITTSRDGKDYTVVVKNNVVTGLFINSERIPDEKFAEYKALTDQIIADHVKEVSDEEKRMKELAHAEKLNKAMKLKNKAAMLDNERAKKEHEQKAKEKAEKVKEVEFKLKSDKEFQLKKDKDFQLKSDKDFKLKKDNEEAVKEKRAAKERERRQKEAQREKRDQALARKERDKAEARQEKIKEQERDRIKEQERRSKEQEKKINKDMSEMEEVIEKEVEKAMEKEKKRTEKKNNEMVLISEEHKSDINGKEYKTTRSVVLVNGHEVNMEKNDGIEKPKAPKKEIRIEGDRKPATKKESEPAKKPVPVDKEKLIVQDLIKNDLLAKSDKQTYLEGKGIENK